MNAAPRARLGRLEDEVAAHRPAQLARHVEPEAAALVRRPRRRRARSARTAARGPPRRRRAPWSAMVTQQVAGLGSTRDRRRRSAVRPPYLTALSSSAHSTWSSWSRVGERRASPRSRRRARTARPSTPSASHVRRTRAAGRDDLDPRPQRARLDPAHGQQLADHPRQPVGLLGDDPEAAVRRVRRQLLGVAADARERRLEVVRDAAQEVVLGLVEARAGAGSGPRPRVQLGVADGRGHLDREQLEQVLVRALPAAGRRQVARRRRRARSPAATRSARTGTGSPGTTSSVGISRGSTSSSSQSIIPNATRRLVGGPARRSPRARSSQARSTRARRGSGAARGCGAPRSRGEAVVALGEAAELVVAGQLEARPDRRRPRPGRRSGRSRAAARRGRRRAAPARSTANTTDDGDREQQDARDAVSARPCPSRAGRRCRTRRPAGPRRR